MDYYNDNEPFVGEWLENLILCGHIPDGTVDRRPIQEVTKDDLDARRVHFFAGIGGWAEALRLACWPEDREVWTGSCPCQPFSSAGKQKGVNDERHLWPELRRLIAECKPATIFGEQVASKAGREWLSVVRTDLEALGYAVGAADLCAAGVGRPHIRQRLYWVANALCARLEERVSDSRAQRYSDGAPAWETAELLSLQCRDGKTRPVMPGVRLLAHGFPNRVGLLRGFGNAIVPQVAAAFIESFLAAEPACQ
jgi:DNA (cytosine-5)-methyltransferase 1